MWSSWLRSRRGRGVSQARPTSAAAAEAPPEVLPLRFPACLREAFPDHFEVAWWAVERTIEATRESDLGSLARRSPALAGYDWETYLRCSAARMVRVSAALAGHVPAGARVLDYGAYLGNFSLMAARRGYAVDALDGFSAHPDAFRTTLAGLRQAGVRILDHADVGADLVGVPSADYAAVLCLGVIEHVPHTPRPMLEALDRVLAPGGILVLDTPNLAYLYNRQRLNRGESVHYPLASQYRSELPFEGHHREYVPDEIAWMVEQLGHEPLGLELFGYSQFGLPELAGADLENHRRMERDPSARELILSVSRKPL